MTVKETMERSQYKCKNPNSGPEEKENPNSRFTAPGQSNKIAKENILRHINFDENE